MLAMLRAVIGREVVVDYMTASGTQSYAKGLLQSVEGTKICIRNSTKIWIVDESSIVNVRIDTSASGEESDEAV